MSENQTVTRPNRGQGSAPENAALLRAARARVRAAAESGGYEDLEPLFMEMAELAADDPMRQVLRAAVIRRALPLADHIARKFTGRGEPSDDIRQVARVGLVLAVDRFDAVRGSRFLSFAVPTVTGEVRRHFRDHTWSLRIPRPVQELHLRLSPAIQALSQRLNRAPTTAEIAAELDVDPAEVTEAIVAGNAYRPESIDLPGYDGDDRPLSDTLSHTDIRLDQVEGAVAVAPLIAALSDRDRYVLSLRFFESQSQTQIAAKLGVSQMQVSRILATILTTLRSQVGAVR